MNQSLKQSLIILKRISFQQDFAEEALKYIANQMHLAYNRRPLDEMEVANVRASMYCTIYYAIMWYASFLEEYDRLVSTDPGCQAQIISVRRNAQQYLDTLEKIFPNIREVRNKVFAHPYRENSSSGAAAITDDLLNKLHNSVMNYASVQPYTQIPNCIRLTIQEIEKQFGEIDAEFNLSS